MDETELRVWGAAVQSAGIDAFARDIVSFPYTLLHASAGTVGRDDPQLNLLLGSRAAWLDDQAVQERLQAVLYYQAASTGGVKITGPKGGVVQINNPLFGAALRADVEQAGEPVVKLLATAARRQDGYLRLTKEIPEWCEFRLFQVSGDYRTMYWLPRNKRLKRRRLSALRANSRG